MNIKAALLSASLAGFCLAADAETSIDEFHVGFVSHYPVVKPGADTLWNSGATIAITRAPWNLIEKSPGKWDFACLEEQLSWADTHNRRVVLITECGPAHCVKWLRKQVHQAGQASMDFAGRSTENSEPSIFSPVYRERMDAYIRAVVQHVEKHPLGHRVIGYNNGCEWWNIAHHAYNPADVAAFRKWLEQKHGTVASLNRAWGSSFKSFNEVDAPRGSWDNMGGRDALGIYVPPRLDAAWFIAGNHLVPVKEDVEYAFTSKVRQKDLKRGGSRACIVFFRTDEPSADFVQIDSEVCRVTNRWTTVQVRGKAPAGAKRASLQLRSAVEGEVEFQEVHFETVTPGALPVSAPTLENTNAWQFTSWSCDHPAALASRLEGGIASIRYLPPGTTADKYWDAALQDWFAFLQEATADFIDHVAGVIKENTAKPVVGYLTFSFAMPFNWDYTALTSIATDQIIARSRHLDIAGMQLSSANADYDNMACMLDLARKTGKPTWVIDLQDFGKGTGIGADAIARNFLAAVSHGATGVIGYGWGEPNWEVYDYARMPASDVQRTISLVRKTGSMLMNTTVATDAALLLPNDPRTLFSSDVRDTFGLYKLLADCGITVDVFTPRELAEASLGRYKLLMVPDAPALPGDCLSVIEKFLKSGGMVVQSGRGPKIERADGRLLRFPDGLGKAYCPQITRTAKITDTPAMFVLPEGARPVRDERDRFLRALNRAGYRPGIRVETGDVDVVQRLGNGRRFVVFVPRYNQPVPNLEFRIEAGAVKGTLHRDDSEPVPIAAKKAGRDYHFRIPGFKHVAVLEIEL